MRIGILTLPLHTNYGGILQAYALQTVLERMGHEVYIIQKDQSPENPNPYWKRPLVYGKRIIKKAFWCHQTEIFVEKRLTKEYTYTCQHTNAFLHNNLNLFMVSSISKLRKDLFDAIVVGSDQIWRPKYIRTVLKEESRQAFLYFTKNWNIIRVAYAASFGVDKWEFDVEETQEIKGLVHIFNAISVREVSGVTLCNKYLGVDAKHVLDPTMLLQVNDYLSLANTIAPSQRNGIMLKYILDESAEKNDLVSSIAFKRHLIPYQLNYRRTNSLSIKDNIISPVEEWIAGFRDAEFIVTDSFHACVFAIIFNKPFLVIGNVNRGLSRIESLLDIFGLKHHLIKDVSHYDPYKSYELPTGCSKILNEWQYKSIEFLKNCLTLANVKNKN